ncbi:MAG: ribonucleotide reductase subunit alpha [Rhizobacter sp.]|nr:ribonucleotide reductase subunit alpha [Burkholderiaceae bacterium]MCO5124794.1 ribonucleotide reductase subunit alpha [Rhizobacter sp.]
MNITHFNDLLQAARAQPEPQRLLFVFAGAELPADASAEQRRQFEAGEGGELAPLMCVDKSPDELAGFDALVAEAAQAGPPWAIVFTAALAGRAGVAPTSVDAEAPLQRMVEAIKEGRIDDLLPFDRQGDPVRFG